MLSLSPFFYAGKGIKRPPLAVFKQLSRSDGGSFISAVELLEYNLRLIEDIYIHVYLLSFLGFEQHVYYARYGKVQLRGNR